MAGPCEEDGAVARPEENCLGRGCATEKEVTAQSR